MEDTAAELSAKKKMWQIKLCVLAKLVACVAAIMSPAILPL